MPGAWRQMLCARGLAFVWVIFPVYWPVVFFSHWPLGGCQITRSARSAAVVLGAHQALWFLNIARGSGQYCRAVRWPIVLGCSRGGYTAGLAVGAGGAIRSVIPTE